jgi:hypothetical protein
MGCRGVPQTPEGLCELIVDHRRETPTPVGIGKELLALEDLRHALHKKQADLDDELPNLRKVTFEPDGAITIVRRLPKERGFEKPSRKKE